MCTNCIDRGTDNSAGFLGGRVSSARFHQIIEGPCLVCKKICGIASISSTVLPAGSQFSGNYICGECFGAYLGPVLQDVLEKQETGEDLAIA